MLKQGRFILKHDRMVSNRLQMHHELVFIALEGQRVAVCVCDQYRRQLPVLKCARMSCDLIYNIDR